MPDDLRTRIAKVLCDLYEHRCCDECDVNRIEFNYREYLEDADAVIAALGLEPQMHYDPDCEFYRYVTDWIDPQTNQRVDLP